MRGMGVLTLAEVFVVTAFIFRPQVTTPRATCNQAKAT